MADNIGVSIEEFTQAVVDSYKKGFADAIECLKVAATTINTDEMKISIKDILQKQGKVKAEW